ncbi:MAG: hypothetical protein IJY42_02495, partial [Clostridia bacterium]|nr:hypothetical protein [Clostridia bacterium]
KERKSSMDMVTSCGGWKEKKVLFIGDSLTAQRIYPEELKRMLGIQPFYHCKGGASLLSMVDGDNGLDGLYDNETAASNSLRPLTAQEVTDMDLIVFFGGYNSRHLPIGQVGDCYCPDRGEGNTVAGHVQYAINRIYQVLAEARHLDCRLLIVTVDCSGQYPYFKADGYTELTPGDGRSLEHMANMQKAVAQANGLPVCDLFHTSGINRHTWSVFGADPFVRNPRFSAYRLDANGNPVSEEEIRYRKGECYYQKRDGKVVLEEYTGGAPYPYMGDQLHKSPAGYRRIAEVIAGAILASYGKEI